MKAPITCAAMMLAAMAPARAALTISTAPTSNVACAAGACSATAADAVLNVKDLKVLLKQGDLKLVSGAGAMDIIVDAKFSWTKKWRLTLDAWRSIVFDLAVTSEGKGGVSLITNDGGSGGEVLFADKGHLTFWDLSSSLVIDGASYVLVNDLDALGAAVGTDPAGHYALARAFKSVKSYAKAPVATLNGVFDGLGHTVADFKTGGSSGSVALISQVGAGGIVRNLALLNVSITTTKHQAGALASENDGTIDNVSVQGSILGHDNGKQVIGGLVGDNKGTVRRAFADVTVTAGESSTAGGLVGTNAGTIDRSHTQGSVFVDTALLEDAWVGGLVGRSGGTITRSSSSMTVKADGGYSQEWGDFYAHAGGLAGLANVVTQSYSAGTVQTGGQSDGGGLVSYSSGAVTDCYSLSRVDVVGGGDVGGLLGDTRYAVHSSYAAGHVGSGSGGLIGYDTSHGQAANSYWDIDTTGTNDGAGWPDDDPGITGLSDAEMKSGLPAGFDPSVWAQDAAVNSGFPYLIDNPPR